MIQYFLITLNWTYNDDVQVFIISKENLKAHDLSLYSKIKKVIALNSSSYFSNFPGICLSIDEIEEEYEVNLFALSEKFPVMGSIVGGVEILICD